MIKMHGFQSGDFLTCTRLTLLHAVLPLRVLCRTLVVFFLRTPNIGVSGVTGH